VLCINPVDTYVMDRPMFAPWFRYSYFEIEKEPNGSFFYIQNFAL
jgi:hypothetical protein